MFKDHAVQEASNRISWGGRASSLPCSRLSVITQDRGLQILR